MIIYEPQPQVQVEEEVQGGGGSGGFGNSLGYFEGKTNLFREWLPVGSTEIRINNNCSK